MAVQPADDTANCSRVETLDTNLTSCLLLTGAIPADILDALPWLVPSPLCGNAFILQNGLRLSPSLSFRQLAARRETLVDLLRPSPIVGDHRHDPKTRGTDQELGHYSH